MPATTRPQPNWPLWRKAEYYRDQCARRAERSQDNRQHWLVRVAHWQAVLEANR